MKVKDNEEDIFIQNLQKRLEPATIKLNLQYAASFLLTYEVLKSLIIDKTKTFFTNGHIEGKDILDGKYRNHVLKLDKDILIASAKWFKEMEIIDDKDIENIELFRKHRNILAHEVMRLLVDIEIEVNKEYLNKMKVLIERIELWWIENFEVFFWDDVSEEDLKTAKSGNMVMLDYLFQILHELNDNK